MSAGQEGSSPGEGRYFTLEGYQSIIERAVDSGYRIVPFREFEGVGSDPVMLLRHDLDHDLHRVTRMVDLEAKLGVRATYFVQTTCEFYNLLSRSGRELLARITECGHEIGLHYESRRYAGTDGGKNLEADVRMLEILSGQSVVSAAQHLPSDGDPVDVLGVLENEAYEPRFTEPPMHYISDSLMVWRQATPHDLIDRGVSFQFLSHPEAWVDSREDMFDTLEGLKEQEIQRVGERFDALSGYYRHLLQSRGRRDRAFRSKRER